MGVILLSKCAATETASYIKKKEKNKMLNANFSIFL